MTYGGRSRSTGASRAPFNYRGPSNERILRNLINSNSEKQADKLRRRSLNRAGNITSNTNRSLQSKENNKNSPSLLAINHTKNGHLVADYNKSAAGCLMNEIRLRRVQEEEKIN